MPDPTIEALYDDDPEPDEFPLRAIEAMPFWGQCFAWLSWRLPLRSYAVAFVAGLGVCFWSVPVGVAVALLALALLGWGFYCRTNYRSPWSYVVIQTNAPVPGPLREAAATGQAVPPEHPDAAAETET